MNPKVGESKANQNESENEKPKNANKYLLSFLLDNSEENEEDDYFKNSDEESFDEKNNNNSNSNNMQISNVNYINKDNNDINSGNNNSISNYNGSSTKDNSSNNYLNISQKNNFLFNNPSTQFNLNGNFYFKNNNSKNYNQNNMQNLSMNNNNFNLTNFHNNYFNTNNINISNNNFSSNSLNNNIQMGHCFSNPQSWNSFSGISPINSLNISNNNFQTLSFNNNNNINNINKINNMNNNINNMNNNTNNKCLSFNKEYSQEKKKEGGYKIMKYKHSQNLKFSLDDDNQINLPIKKLFDMPDQSLYKFMITQKGSREVQNIIEKLKEKEIDLLIYKLKNYISDITMDKYGNYFCRKLVQICLPYQRIQILEYIKSKFVEISNNTYGTHPLQSLIQIIKLPQEKQLVLSYILGNELALALDTKGTHILQKFISSTIDEERKELNKNILNIIDKLILDQYGVYVLIVLVKNTNDKSIRQIIANYITNGGPLNFIQHPYANYAVQSLIKSSDLSYCDIIIDTIIQNYLSLSMQKFSSNVVENCIKYGEEKTVKKIYNSIIEEDKLESLLNNTYGNFVLEKLIERLKIEEKLVIIKKIENFGKNKNISKNILNLLYK